MKVPLSILHINSRDVSGGAARIASDLCCGMQDRGNNSTMLVGEKISNRSDVFLMPNQIPSWWWEYVCFGAAKRFGSLRGRVKGCGFLANLLCDIARPKNLVDRFLGREKFEYPGIEKYLASLPKLPDIIHCHNLHRNFFDLRVLSQLSKQIPIVMTLHDTWLLSGHCAYSLECELWKSGCNACDKLFLYPGIRCDAAAYNWKRKEKIYRNSSFFIVTPSQWLMNKVNESMLAHAVCGARVIHNGVDQEIFKPALNKAVVRQRLGLTDFDIIIVYVAAGGSSNQWKFFDRAKEIVRKISLKLSEKKLLMVCVGGKGEPEYWGNSGVIYRDFLQDKVAVAEYYQAADIYLHAAKADTFPTTILEALSCGVPVLGSLVDGIPEQIKSLRLTGCDNNKVVCFPIEEATGMVLENSNIDAWINALEFLILSPNARTTLSENAFKDARERFNISGQIDAYEQWYYTVLEEFKMHKKSV